MSASRIEVNDILRLLIHAMLDYEGDFVFTFEIFHREWQKLLDFFGTDKISVKMVAPIPYLAIAGLPLRLNDELMLDRLTDDEVTHCYRVGVLRPVRLGFPFIHGESAVGIRRTNVLPKLIRRRDEPHELPEVEDEGSFGKRPISRDDLIVDDVLSALRLFKKTQIRAASLARWTDSPWLKSGIMYRILGQWPYGGKFEISECEIPCFLELWHLLEEGSARFGFSIHRFNLAFERGLLADRIVDLIIAAESLLLSDLDNNYRGELRFRFALRAAKFIVHTSYGEHDVFRMMRQAYDARSVIVHGGSPKETRLPDNRSANLVTFIDAIEALVRLGLRKALSMREDGSKMRQADYWDTLLFSRPASRACRQFSQISAATR